MLVTSIRVQQYGCIYTRHHTPPHAVRDRGGGYSTKRYMGIGKEKKISTLSDLFLRFTTLINTLKAEKYMGGIWRLKIYTPKGPARFF